MLEHKPAKIAVIVATLIVFIVTAVLNAYASQPEYSSGIFTSNPANISAEFMTEITPATWTFGIWGVIYLWMALWIVYCNAAIYIQWDNYYLYTHEAFMPGFFYVLYIINMIINVTWLVLFDRKFIFACFFVLLAMAVTAIVCLAIAIYSLSKYLCNIPPAECGIHFWLIQIFIYNGIGCYAAWLTVATLLNLNVALIHVWGISSSNTIILIILLVVGASWLSLDMIVSEKHTRYLVTPYLVLVVALYGIVYEHVDLNDIERIAIFMIVVLAIFCGSCLYKIVIVFWKHCKNYRSRTWV